MALTVHQYKTAAVPPVFTPASNYTSISATWDTQPTAGRGLTLVVGVGKNTPGTADTPDGWTLQANITVDIRRLQVFTRQAEAGEPTTVTVTHPGARRLTMFMVEHDGEFGAITTDTDPSQTTHALPSITPTASAETLLLGFIEVGNNQGVTVNPTGYTFVDRIYVDDGASERVSFWSRYVSSASGSYTGTATFSAACFGCQVQLTVYAVPDPPVADFSASDTSIFEGQAVQFTDLSTNVPTSWAWTFGDGGTSTSQNPEHTYATAGTYTVTLTATNAFGSDIETKSSYITVAVNVGFDEPPPAQALIEIYTAEPGSAKWDEANWDEAEWSTAGWQNVTPESVQAVVVWGSSEPELGILSRPSAGSWSIDTYDPDRLLDPANEDSPYFGDLEPGLPIRISHRGVVIRQGIVESMSFGFADDRGFIRVQDNIAPMANAMVPDDVDLGDTLYARAEAAIAAAGLAVQVLPVPPTGDPALVPWVTGTSRSAWQWIVDAAESVLHIPYIDNIGRLGFRAWATPLSRARDLTATELIDLVSLVQYDGLFSVVTALDDDGVTVVERASTPPPRYGARTYERNSATPNVDTWLEAVLADRVRSGRRWIPGQVYPLNAASVEKYATIEAVEVISLSHLFTSPPVAQDIIIVGGRITLTSKQNDEARWAFQFEAAETVQSPLITEDGLGFVLSEGGDQFLYPE